MEILGIAKQHRVGEEGWKCATRNFSVVRIIEQLTRQDGKVREFEKMEYADVCKNYHSLMFRTGQLKILLLVQRMWA